MHGLVVLDEHDQVIRPAILWNDGRTAEEVDWLNNTVGKDKLSAWTANIAFAGFTAPKVLWLKKHEPEHFARIQKVMLPKDYINYVLTGVHCTDYSDASGMLLLDVAHKRWSQEMLDLCGLREAQMPRLFESYEAVGTLRPDIAARLGLSPDVVVCAPAPATTPPPPSAPERWGTGRATSPWAPRAPSSSPAGGLGWTPTTPSTPSPTPTDITI